MAEKLVGVYDEAQARGVLGRLRAAGVPDTELAIGEGADEVRSLEAEQREEMSHAWVAPQAALAVPKEGVKGAALLLPAAAVLGALIALPFAFLIDDTTRWIAALIAMSVGAAAGATVGWVVGAGVAVRGPAEPLAAERGVTVSAPATAAAERVMRAAEPIRLDRVEDEQPVQTMASESDSTAGSLRHNLEQPEGDWSGVRRSPAPAPRRRRGPSRA